MGIEKDLVEPTLANVTLVNLDLDEQARKAVLREVATHLDALAAMPPLSVGAENVMRMISAMTPPWGDAQRWHAAMSEALRGKAEASYGDPAA